MSTPLRNRVDWRHHAACHSVDPELFFPAGRPRAALVQVAAARAVCSHCPVESDCLSWALAQGQVSGVWGGTTEAERRALRVLPHLQLLDR
jgi:WhiB family redox-sensing transcriptional regulator